MRNPYQMAVPKQGHSAVCQARRMLEPIIAEHMEGFGDALEGREAKDPIARVRAHTLLRSAMAAGYQARSVALEWMGRQNLMVSAGDIGGFGFEAALTSSSLVANVTAFITQMIHMSLDVYPRLIAPNLVSVQPFTQPSGFVFFLKRTTKESGADRNLDDLDTFDKTYSNRTTEGEQVKAVGITLTKQLVEVQYQALMHQFSHEVDVALRSQYGLDIMALGDIATAQELAWEVDRHIVDDLVVFAGTNSQGTVFFDDTAGGLYSGFAPSEQQAYDKKFVRETITIVGVDMATKIYVRPSWYLCGANVAKLLARTPEALAEDTGNKNFDQAFFKGSIIQSGRMRSGETVWLDPQLDVNTMIAGFTDQMDPFYAGYVFSPFGLASVLTAAFQDPDTLLTKRARALAFAKVGVRAEQYRVIKLGTAS